jgi:uncharacterized protein YcfJ
VISFAAFADELQRFTTKLAADVTREDASAALGRLHQLEANGPTPAQVARGAAVGALAGPIASNVNKFIGKGEFHSPREIAGQVAGGLIMGTAVPLMRRKLETTAERRTLRDYINAGHSGRLATQIEDKLAT